MGQAVRPTAAHNKLKLSYMALDKFGIARRIAVELRDGMYINLGIGIPTLVANYIPEGIEVIDRKSTRLNSSHDELSRMPSSA